MSEPYQSNIRHFLADPNTPWQCVLCHAVVSPSMALEHQKMCIVENRIREIIRSELASVGKSEKQS